MTYKHLLMIILVFFISCEKGWLNKIIYPPGCVDESACNYEPDASKDDNSCMYLDCLGECGGTTLEDCEGICGGNAIVDCADECNGTAEILTYWYDYDNDGLGGIQSSEFCSEIVEEGWVLNNDDGDDNCSSNIYDCANICDGNAEILTYWYDYDNDGLGSGQSSEFCSAIVGEGWVLNNDDGDDNCSSNIHDCTGVCDGNAIINECGCVGGSTNLGINFCYGCNDPNAINFDNQVIINDGSCSFYEDFSNLSDWYNVNGWIITTSTRCVDDGSCAYYYQPNYNNNLAPTMERDFYVYEGQILTYYYYSDWGGCTLYLNDVNYGSCSFYVNSPIELPTTGNLNVKFVGSSGALTRAWIDDLRIE